jgi:hypothetical protein
MDLLRHSFRCIIAGTILHIRSTTSPDGVPRGFPSLTLTYSRRAGEDDGVSGFAKSDRGNTSSSRSTFILTFMSVQQVTGSLALEAAEDHGAIIGQGRILRIFDGGHGGLYLRNPIRLRCTKLIPRVSSGKIT